MHAMRQNIIRNWAAPQKENERANLQSLRRSIAWTTSPNVYHQRNSNHTAQALDERLESLLVLQLHKDGSRQYLSVSVRGLYKHVLKAITKSPVYGNEDDALEGDRNVSPKSPRRRPKKVVRAELGNALVPLGMAVANGTDQPLDPDVMNEDGPEEAYSENAYDDEPYEEEAEEDEPYEEVAEEEETNSGPEKRVKFEGEPEMTIVFDSQQAVSNLTATMPATPKSPSHSKATRRGTVSKLAHGNVEKHKTGKDAEGSLTFRERLGGYLHPRDMRRLVTPFSASNEPEVIVRRHVILLNFDPLRAIILRDRLLIIVPDGADSVLVQLEHRVRGDEDQVESFLKSEDPRGLGSSIHSKDSTKSGGNLTSIFSKLRHTKNGGRDASSLAKPHLPSSSQASSDADSTADEIQDSMHSSGDNSDKEDLDSEWLELKDSKWVDLPYELQCVDAVLYVVSDLLSTDTAELQEASMNYIQRLLTETHSMSDDPLTIIRAVKDAVREMTSRVKGFVTSIERLLDEDEDMALMNLSRLLTHPERFIHPVSAVVLDEESDEPELILESYLQVALSLANSLHLIQGQIDSAAELVDQKQDAIRNRLLFANMIISIFSLCVACASLVGSLFGMNVTNFLEDRENAFRQITYGTIAGAAVMAAFIIFVLMKSRTIPSLSTLFAGDAHS